MTLLKRFERIFFWLKRTEYFIFFYWNEIYFLLKITGDIWYIHSYITSDKFDKVVHVSLRYIILTTLDTIVIFDHHCIQISQAKKKKKKIKTDKKPECRRPLVIYWPRFPDMEIDHYEYHLEVEKDKKYSVPGDMDDSVLDKENGQDDTPLPPVRRREKKSKSRTDNEERVVSYLGPIYLNSISSSMRQSSSLTRYRKSYPVATPWAVMCAVETVGNDVNIEVHPWDGEEDDDTSGDSAESLKNGCRYDGDGEESEQRGRICSLKI